MQMGDGEGDGGWVAGLVICEDTAQDTTTKGGLITEQVP